MNLFIDDEVIIPRWVDATNAFGRHYIPGWRVRGVNRWDTNALEFKAFLAVVNMTGILGFANREEMFRRGPREFAYIHSITSVRRFSTLLLAWHYVNVEEYRIMEPALQAAYRRAHPFYQVEGLVETLQNRFRRYYRPGQLVDIDEQCIPWKGRHRCRCYNPKKPVKWHFKVFSLNDAGSGYCSNFYFYEGKAETRPPGIPATEFPFYKLFTSPGGEDPDQYRNKNHILATDNWFTSVEALQRVVESGNHCIGTVKGNRGGDELIALIQYNVIMFAVHLDNSMI